MTLSWVFFAGRAELWRLRCDSSLTVSAVLRIPDASSHWLALEAQNFLCRRPKHFGLQGSEVPKELSCSRVWVAALHRPGPALAVGDRPGCSKGSTARSRRQGQRRRLPAFGGACAPSPWLSAWPEPEPPLRKASRSHGRPSTSGSGCAGATLGGWAAGPPPARGAHQAAGSALSHLPKCVPEAVYPGKVRCPPGSPKGGFGFV